MYTDAKFGYKLGTEIRPSTKLRTYNLIGSLAITAFVMLFVIPTVLFAPLGAAVGAIVVALLILVPVYLWVMLYYRSISYRFTETEMVWKRGVWFRATGIVPYSKVTNVDIIQGPLMRALGIASLRVQTAGYNAASGPMAELRIEGVQDYEALRELIMGFVRGQKLAPQAAIPLNNEARMLEELVKIRQLLEEQARRQ